MTTPTTDVNSILMGGGGAPAFKFSQPGDEVSGRIVHISEPYQEREYDPANPGGGAPKFFPKSGKPIMTFNLDLATNLRDPSIEDDDGTRRIYMDGARIKNAVRDAIRAAGASSLAVGATLTIRYDSDKVPGDRRSGKNYKVTYVPGSAADNVLQQPDPEAQPAQQPAAQQPQTAPGQPTQQQLEAIKAAGMDPKDVFPNYEPAPF